MRNWMLPRFPNNYRTERDSDEKAYYAELQQEWDFRVNESNALHNESAVTKIKKENNLMILRRSRYHMLQLAEELAAATNKQLTLAERNNVLNYEDYLSE